MYIVYMYIVYMYIVYMYIVCVCLYVHVHCVCVCIAGRRAVKAMFNRSRNRELLEKASDQYTVCV